MAKRKKRRRIRMQPRFFLIMVAALGAVIIVLLLVKKVQSDSKELLEATPVPTATLAPTIMVLSKCVLKNRRSRNAISVAFAEA